MLKLRKKMSKKILLITTKGCTGCRIQIENLKQAIINNKKDIHLVITDFEDLTKNQIKAYRNDRVFLKDFPTTVFKNNETITFKMVGSTPTIVLQRYIDLYMK